MKDKICVYCGRPATTKDHTPTKSFYDVPLPSNLKTVPCCRECNSEHSLDEQYFLVFLSHVSSSPILHKKTEEGGSIDRTLERSPALEQRFLDASTVDEEGRILLTAETERINKVLRKNAIGLYFHRYKKVPILEYITNVAAYPCGSGSEIPVGVFISTFTERFKRKQWKVLQKTFLSIFLSDIPKATTDSGVS